MPKTVIFDLDGTLADTSGDLIAAANSALQTLGHAPQLHRGADDAIAVRGGRRMLQVAHERLGITGAAAAAGIEAGYPVLLEAYDAAIDVHTTMYPGSVAAVEAIIAAGFRAGICTNKPETMADKLLKSLGVRGLFGSLVGADTLPVRKPDPAPYRLAVDRAGGVVEQSLLVGDSDTDRNTAKAAGVPSVLVSFGPEGDKMAALSPEAIIHHFDELPETVSRLLGD